MLLLSQFFLPTFKSKQEAKSFSIYETKWEFHPDGHRAMLRIYKFPSPQTELTQYTAILSSLAVFRYTAVFFNWLFSFSAPSTKTTYVSYTNHAIWLHILKMGWHGSGKLRQNRIQWLKPKHETSVLFVDKRMDSWTFFPGYFIRKPRRPSKKWRQKLPFMWAANKTGHWQRGKRKKKIQKFKETEQILESTMLHVILIVSILWLWKFFHSCPTVSDLHWKMRSSLVLATLVYNLGLWVCKCHVGSMPIQFFYTNNLFIIKECFWNVEGSWVFGHLCFWGWNM